MNDQTRALETAPSTLPGGYEVSRLNAIQHGILSKHTVLPWEDECEYGTLLAALSAEHTPRGPTEEHFVEELAGIIWRKRRIRLAERASHQQALERTTKSYSDTDKTALVGLPDAPKEANVRIALTMTAEELRATQATLEDDKAKTIAALHILEGNQADSYADAIEALDDDTAKAWRDQLTWEPDDYRYDVEPYAPTSASLVRYLKTEIMPWYTERDKELLVHPIVRQHAFDASFNPDRMEKLARYEAHLDRKLERTLSMLIKLQELRSTTSKPAR